MTLTPTKMCARLGTAAALALLLAVPAPATDVTMEFDAANFDFPTAANLTNPYLSYGAGDIFYYMAETPDGCEWSIVTVEGTVPIDVDPGPGVTNLNVREVSDLEYEDEACDGPDHPAELVETTLDWYGEDNLHNVWYFGEDSRECLAGVCDAQPGEGSWLAFEDGALPGIIMLGDPDSGERYRQEFAEEVALDWAKVMNLNGMPVLKLEDAVDSEDFEDCLVTKEWNELEAGAVEQKTYCPGVGLVLVEEHSGALVRFELVMDTDPPEEAADAFTFREVR